MSDAVSVRGVVVSHGLLAEGLIDAVRRITGIPAGVLVGLSNSELSPDALLAELRRLAGEGPVIVFTDMSSGSCSLAARRLLREDPAIMVIGGVNLPLLLDFVVHRDRPYYELATRLVEKGRAAITCVTVDHPRHGRTPLSSR